MSYGDWAQWKRRRAKLVREGGGALFRVKDNPVAPEVDEWVERHGLDFSKVLGYATPLEVAETIAAQR